MQFGDSEMLRFHNVSDFGHTDSYTSVRPSSTCVMAWAKSVRPKLSDRSVRDEFGGNLTLSLCTKSNLKEVVDGYINLNHGKKLGIDLCARVRVKESTK